MSRKGEDPNLDIAHSCEVGCNSGPTVPVARWEETGNPGGLQVSWPGECYGKQQILS